MRKALVVLNINAGRKKAIKYKKLLLKFLRKKYDSYKLIDIEQLNNEQTNLFDDIIAVGGDGTVNKVLPYIINTDKTLAIIPCGTANLLAAKLGISTNIKKAISIIEKGRKEKIDIISINNKPCILRFGLGYDADIITKTPQSIKNKFGYFSYFVAGILFALRLNTRNYHIFYDNKEINTEASCIIIANAANMYKNWISVCKNDKLNDGLMDIFILKTNNPIIFGFEILNILLNRKINNARAMYFNALNLQIRNNWTMCHIDGEKQKFKEDLIFKIINKAINVYY